MSEWYGSIPQRWDIVSIGQYFNIIKDIAGEEGYPVYSITQNGLKIKDISVNNGQMAKNYEKYQFVKPGDFAMNHMDLLTGFVGIASQLGVTSPDYRVFRIIDEIKCDRDYFLYVFQLCYYRKIFYGFGRGASTLGRWRMPRTAFLGFQIPLPSIDEQSQIVRFLNWKMSRIYSLINTKKRQVTLLREMIDTLANQAIKQSQEKRRMKVIVNVIRDWIDRNNETEYQPIGVLNRGRGIFYKQALQGADLGDSEFFYIKPDSLMFSGQFAWEGAVGITQASEEGCIASHRYYTVQSESDECSTEYLWAFFQTKYGDMILNDCSHGAAGRNRPLNFNELMNEYILIPTKELNEKITKLVRLYYIARSKQKEFEGYLREYRTRLISDVVTGKIDVRDAIIPDYEAVEETAENEEVEDDEEKLAEEAGDE